MELSIEWHGVFEVQTFYVEVRRKVLCWPFSFLAPETTDMAPAAAPYGAFELVTIYGAIVFYNTLVATNNGLVPRESPKISILYACILLIISEIVSDLTMFKHWRCEIHQAIIET